MSEPTGHRGRRYAALAIALVIFAAIFIARERQASRATSAGVVVSKATAKRALPRLRGAPTDAESARVGLSGRISDASGGALPGALVRVKETVRYPATELKTSGQFEALADEDGRYRLPLVAARYRVEVGSPGYAPVREMLDLTVEEVRDYRLHPAARIAGRVIAGDERSPVEGAEVTLARAERRFDPVGPAVTTDGDGKFLFDLAPAGTFVLTARQGELVGSLAQPLTIAAAGHAEGIEIEVSAGLVVDGTVSSADGKPIAGAGLGLDASGRGADPALSTRSDAGGRFRIAGVAPGQYRLWAWADGWLRVAEPLMVFTSVSKNVILAPAARISGVVLTARGQPAAGAWVEACTFRAGEDRVLTADRTLADPAGRFVLERLGPGQMKIGARLGNESALTKSALGQGEKRDLTLRLQPGGARISGTTRWEDGTPAAGLQVRGEQSALLSRELIVQSGPDGHFTVGPFVEGKVMVMATAPGELLGFSGGDHPPPRQANLTLGDGEQKTGVTLVVPRRDGAIRGVVVGPEGAPIAGASVLGCFETERGRRAWKPSHDAARAVTGADGAFTLESLRKGTYTIWVSAPDHPEAVRAGAAVGSEVRFQLGRAASLSGVVVGGDGQPIPSYALVVVPPGSSEPQGFLDAVGEGRSRPINDGRGAFRVDGLGPGNHDLVVNAFDGRSGMLAVTLAEGEQKSAVRLVAKNPVAVSGRVIDGESGQPVSGVALTVRAGATVLRGSTDAHGAFLFERVPTVMGIFGQLDSKAHRREDFAAWAGPDGHADVGVIRLRRAGSI